MFGGAGNDTLTGAVGDDSLSGDADSDLLYPGVGVDSVNGGPGSDTIAYGTAPNAIVVDLTAGTATGWGTDTLVQVENVLGSTFSDTLTGDASNNALSGNVGNDTDQQEGAGTTRSRGEMGTVYGQCREVDRTRPTVTPVRTR